MCRLCADCVRALVIGVHRAHAHHLDPSANGGPPLAACLRERMATKECREWPASVCQRVSIGGPSWQASLGKLVKLVCVSICFWLQCGVSNDGLRVSDMRTCTRESRAKQQKGSEQRAGETGNKCEILATSRRRRRRRLAAAEARAVAAATDADADADPEVVARLGQVES